MTKSFVLTALLLALAGCAAPTGRQAASADEFNAAVRASAALPLPARGFQVATPGILIEPGQDVRTCEVIALPGSPRDTFYVSRIEAALSAHGEDLVVSAAEPGSDTEAIMELGTSVPCTRAGEAFGEELVDVTAAQARYRDLTFPDGVGKIFHGGQRLAVEHHFVNETREPLPAVAKLSFHTVEEGAVVHLAHTARFSNFTIYTPPGGKSSHLGECTVRRGLQVSDLLRRTQRFGTTFSVWRLGGEHDGELVWQSESRGDSERELAAAPIALLAGEGFRFQCDFRNTTDSELRYGVSAADETCSLDATFWSETTDSESADADEGCLLFAIDRDGISR